MPLITAFNLRPEDPLPAIEAAVREALASLPEAAIVAAEIDFAPVLAAPGLEPAVARFNVDLWVREERTKARLQELATRIAAAFRSVAGEDRRVTVVIRPYDVAGAGWVSV